MGAGTQILQTMSRNISRDDKKKKKLAGEVQWESFISATTSRSDSDVEKRI